MSTRQNKMKKNIEKMLWIVGIAILLLLITPIEVNAALQANQNTQNTKAGSPTEFMTWFREMEKGGGAMGLDETLNADLTSKESNNIDVHMMRSTEYGAIAILSASGYGNPSNAKAITTTTGNNTGVMLTSWYENVAGGAKDKIFSGVNGRYFDTYTLGSAANYASAMASARVGDALGDATTPNPGAAGWHSATDHNWVYGSDVYFLRGGGGIFSFNNYISGGRPLRSWSGRVRCWTLILFCPLCFDVGTF